MIIKYRVHEVAKDFGKQSKAVVDILAKHFPDDPKKHMTALEDKELDVVFETLTQENQVANFDEYFASANKEKDASAEKEEAPKAEKKPAKKDAPKAKDSEKAPKKAAAKGDKAEKTEKAPKGENQKRNQEAKSDKPKDNKDNKEKDKASKPMQSRTKGDMRRVDTRGGQVELDKYNERYENIAPAVHGQSDRQTNKQKLKQKSQQYRKQGMRSHKRETEAERLKRIAEERAKKPQLVITVPEELTVGELAAMLKMTAAEVIKKLFTSLGIMATVNQTIDFDTAELIATELGAKVEKEVVVTIEDRIIDDSEDKEEDLLPRPPVVVVMGHVDHGKTSLLDAIRDTSVTDTEAGGITQHIGAYSVKLNDRLITFLDTPGHEAFTTMRARGAQVTDVAILVVAADDGIMPQTIEAINHAKAAGVTIVVAINKIDKEGADPERIKAEMAEEGLLPEEWGGDTVYCEISAKKKIGIEELLETLTVVAELADLKANPNRYAYGSVVEGKLDKGRGAVATLLVENGTLRASDPIVVGAAYGRVRQMLDDKGRVIKEALPGTPVEITGLNEVPVAGDKFMVFETEKQARSVGETRMKAKIEKDRNSGAALSLDDLYSQIKEGQIIDLNIIVKADVQGTAEAVKASLEKIDVDGVRVNVIRSTVGAISESDVILASASQAIIYGFNVRPDAKVRNKAEEENVEIRLHNVIYKMVEEIETAMKGMLAPEYHEVITGQAEIRQVIKASKIGNIAGCYVTDGSIKRNCGIRLIRDGIVVYEGKLASLRRFKDDVKEVNAGFECGLNIENYNDIKEGDIIEGYVMEEVEKK